MPDGIMDQFAGQGKVIAILKHPFLLIENISWSDDNEPPFMRVLSIGTPGLSFFDSIEEHNTWRAYLNNDPEPVVKLHRGDEP